MHLSVLQKEMVDYFDPHPNENFIDATFGQGGDSLAILKRTEPEGKILAIEIDSELVKDFLTQKSQFSKRIILINDSFSNLKEIVKRTKFEKIKGVLFDLGISTWHLENSGRGFSFQKNEPLDMRYSKNKPFQLSAEEILNRFSKKEIEKILRDYGEEKFAKRIAQEIVKKRKKVPIKTTFQLVEIIKKATPFWYQKKKIHPATKTFQALRIVVNKELENLKKALPQALEVLEKNGKIVIISFHSLEDRIVKIFFRTEEKKGVLMRLTKKPVLPSKKEITKNPRARSAKLRAAIKLLNVQI